MIDEIEGMQCLSVLLLKHNLHFYLHCTEYPNVTSLASYDESKANACNETPVSGYVTLY